MNAVALAPERLSAADERVLAWLDRFEKALTDGDAAAASRCFASTCFWRDLIALTWNIKTLEGRDAIRAMLETQLEAIRPAPFHARGCRERSRRPHRGLDRVRDRTRPVASATCASRATRRGRC